MRVGLLIGIYVAMWGVMFLCLGYTVAMLYTLCVLVSAFLLIKVKLRNDHPPELWCYGDWYLLLFFSIFWPILITDILKGMGKFLWDLTRGLLMGMFLR